MSWPANGYAHTSTDKARAAERFRHHIWTPNRPHGRIHRPERCCYCRRHCDQLGALPDAHHVDYEKPFLVSWLCVSCHRSVEAGAIKLRADRHLFDYSSLVRVYPARWRSGDRGQRAQDVIGRRRKADFEPRRTGTDEEVPF